VIGLDASDARAGASAKQGIGIHEILEHIVHLVPPPKGDRRRAAARADLRFLVRSLSRRHHPGARVDGKLRKGQKIRLWSNGRFEVEGARLSVAQGHALRRTERRRSGLPLRQHQDRLRRQDRRHHHRRRESRAEPLPGFEEIKPMVFAGLYPVESHEHGLLRDALEKLRLNDSAFSFEPENSVALGFGFRCGFLGLLHLEIVQERLEREFDIDLITTAPGVRYRITTTKWRSDRGR
jgi:GTP-binding protein LepA